MNLYSALRACPRDVLIVTRNHFARNKSGNLSVAAFFLPWREFVCKSVTDKAGADNHTGVTNTPCATRKSDGNDGVFLEELGCLCFA